WSPWWVSAENSYYFIRLSWSISEVGRKESRDLDELDFSNDKSVPSTTSRIDKYEK
ncbi:hypothetical protein B296_00037973, partial [Ensete ventricosum]